MITPLVSPLARAVAGKPTTPVGASAPLFSPLTGVTTIWVYDASIGVGITSGFETIMQQYLQVVHGLTLTVVNKSISGQNLPTILARWEAEKAAVAGRADILVVPMPIGNSIDGTWDTRSESYRSGLISQYAGFIDSVLANGNRVLPVNTTFRLYTAETVAVESGGSQPYNQNAIWPKVQSLVPSMWYQGRPYLDPYEVARNWYSVVLADATHYTIQGYHLLRNLWADAIAARIKGLLPPRVTRVENPAANQVPPAQPFMLTFSAGGVLSKSPSVYWALQRGQSFVGSGSMLPLVGYTPNRITATFSTAAPSGGNNGGAFNNSTLTASLLHDGVKNNYIQSSAAVYAEIVKLSGFAAGQAVRLELLSCRNAAGVTSRWAQFSVDGGATYLDVNGAYNPGAVPQVTVINTTANPAGEVALGWRCREGSTFTYLNGLMAYPL